MRLLVTRSGFAGPHLDNSLLAKVRNETETAVIVFEWKHQILSPLPICEQDDYQWLGIRDGPNWASAISRNQQSTIKPGRMKVSSYPCRITKKSLLLSCKSKNLRLLFFDPFFDTFKISLKRLPGRILGAEDKSWFFTRHTDVQLNRLENYRQINSATVMLVQTAWSNFICRGSGVATAW
jgi:hypothetical protein